MLRRTALGVGRECLSIGRRIVIETEVRDRTEQVDVMLGRAAVLSQMPTKRIDARPLPTERRTIEKAALQTHCCPKAEEMVGEIVNETVMIVI